MRKRIALVMLLFIGVVVGFVWLPGWFSREPKYRGKTTAAWFKEFYRASWYSYGENPAKQEEAADALSVLRTNALPYLLGVYYSTNEDSDLRTGVNAAFAKVSWLGGIQPLARQEGLRKAARAGIFQLKPTRDELLPLLTNRLHGPDAEQRIDALCLLSDTRVGADVVVPYLREMLTVTNASHQRLAVACLSNYGRDASPAAPELAGFLESGPADMASIKATYRLMCQFGPAGSNAVPPLTKIFANTPNSQWRIELAQMLCSLDAHQTEVMAYVVAEATNPKSAQHYSALYLLGTLGTNALPAIPALIEAAKDNRTWSYAAEVLAKLGATNEAIAVLADNLDQLPPLKCINSSIYILQYESANQPAISNLVAFVRDDYWGDRAIPIAAKLRQVPPLVLQAVREIAANQNHKFHGEADRALRAMESLKTNNPSAP